MHYVRRSGCAYLAVPAPDEAQPDPAVGPALVAAAAASGGVDPADDVATQVADLRAADYWAWLAAGGHAVPVEVGGLTYVATGRPARPLSATVIGLRRGWVDVVIDDPRASTGAVMRTVRADSVTVLTEHD